jgi:Flp pilus assembly protein TadD
VDDSKRIARAGVSWASTAAVLVVAAAVRAVYGWQYWHRLPYARAPVVDAEVYVSLAQVIRAGDWLNPELLYHSFLYPYLLAAFPFPSPTANLLAMGVQLGLGVLNTWLVMRIARRLWGAGWIAVASGILYTLTVPLLFFETKLYPEAVGATLMLLVFDQLVAPARAWALGLACGLLVLVRSEASLLAAVAVYRVWNAGELGRPRVRRIAVLLVPVVLCVALAAARNSRIAGTFVASPTATGGLVFYFGNNPNAHGGYGQPDGFAGSAGSIVQESALARRVAEEAAGRPLTVPEVDRWWWRRGLAYLAGDPAHALALLGEKLGRWVAVRETMADLAFYTERGELPILRLLAIPFPALLVLALVGVATDARERGARTGRDALLLALGVSLVVCLLFFVHSRYRVTGVLAAVLLAPRGLRALLDLARPAGVRRAAAGAACLVLVVLVAWSEAVDDTPRDRAVARFNEGIAYERLGEQAKAFARFAQAFEFSPADPAVRNNYARALAATGRRPEAESVLAQGLAADPGATELRVSLGWMRFQDGRAADAEADFREALRREPQSLAAKLSLAFMLQQRATDRAALLDVADRFREVVAANQPTYTRPALLGLGVTYGSLQETDRIDPTFQRMAQLKPLSSLEESEWGVALDRVARHGEARLHHRRAIELDAGNGLAYFRLAQCEQALGDGAAAATHRERARALGFAADGSGAR